MIGENREYTIIKEEEVNPKLLQFLSQVKEEYLDILDKMWDDNKTEYEHRQDLDSFYARVANDLHVKDASVKPELVTLYMFVHNKVRENKNNLRNKFSRTTFTRVNKEGDDREDEYTTEGKKGAISYKKPYADFKSKKCILKKVLPKDILDEAYAKLYPGQESGLEGERLYD